MYLQSLHSLSDIAAAQWDAVVPDHDPFLSHAFLSALERHGCVGEAQGWLPWHQLCRDTTGRLLAAAPLYLKFNSYGEFVFDGHWAEAYRRHGLAYYPKLVGAIPYTPVTSPRLLRVAGPEGTAAARFLIESVLDEARHRGWSSVHWLFPPPTDLELLSQQGLLPRLACQFHWHNHGYRDFQDFLDRFTHKRRKAIQRERRRVGEAGVELHILTGSEISAAQWQRIHRFYCSTFQRLGGIATLTLPFFEETAVTLGERLLVVLARQQGQDIAAAISWRSAETLYGRHWGCQDESAVDGLHFEACYYQGLDYCIEQGLARFEPGAQGEHKLYRGFLPTLTQSAHWIAHPGFRQAIADFLARETPAVRAYAQELLHHSPYRLELTPDAPTVAGPA